MPNYRNQMSGYHNRQNTGSTCKPAAPPQAEPCCTQDDALDGFALAMAYVPWQEWEQTYDIDKGLCRGTIFPQLDKPFCRIGGGMR